MHGSSAIPQLRPLASLLVGRLCSDAGLVVARRGPAASLASRSWRPVLARGSRKRACRSGFDCCRLGVCVSHRIWDLDRRFPVLVNRSSAPTSNNPLHRSPRAVRSAAYALVGRRRSLHLRGCNAGGAGELQSR